MKQPNRLRLLFTAALLTILLATLLAFPPVQVSASASDQAECSLTVNRNRVSVTVSRGPCYAHNFPYWCDAYIPQVVVQGQTIRCEAVVVTATPTRRPTAAPTRTPLPFTERLRNSFTIPGFR